MILCCAIAIICIICLFGYSKLIWPDLTRNFLKFFIFQNLLVIVTVKKHCVSHLHYSVRHLFQDYVKMIQFQIMLNRHIW